MNGQVKNLCEIEQIEVPHELLEIHVDEAALDAQLNALSVRYAEKSEAKTVEKNDTVYVKADAESYPDGRTLLLFTGMNVPGAEAAEQAVVGKKVNETFTAALCGKDVTLTVEKIERRTPVAVNDALIAKIGMEGVKTVEDYRRHLYDKALEDKIMERDKGLIHFYMEQMTVQTTYAYNETEMNAFVESQMEEAKRQCEKAGEPFEEDAIRESIIMQQKQGWMAEAFCKAHGIALQEDEITAQADQTAEMMELMGEPVPSREELLEMARQDIALNGLFEYIGQVITEKTGGANGNG